MKNKEIINEIYENIADELNISDSIFESASKSYKALGEYLESKLEDYKVEVFPQGSMNLGTLIKPISEADDYDLDAVCKVHNSFNDAGELKNLIGDILKKSERYSKMLQPEGKRCWTLKYADGSHFHMDILPSSPTGKLDNSIKITHKENEKYEFRISNPQGYAEWFDKLQESERRKIFSTKNAMFSNKVEDLKNYNVRTTLQKTIQLLKRHRDIKYLNANDSERDNKPISIIITTLVGKMYTGEESIVDLILKFTNDYMKYIDIDLNGNYIIQNPVDNNENFADKWSIYPERKEAFFNWINDLKRDLIINNFMLKEDLIEKANFLKSIFGGETISKVFEKREKENSKSYIKRDNIATLTSTKTETKVKEHTFFGN